MDALDPNNTWTNATVVDTRERLGAPVVLGVGPMGGGGAGECCLFRVVSLQNRVHTEQEREREREREACCASEEVIRNLTHRTTRAYVLH